MSSTFSSAEAVRFGFRQIEEDVHKMNGFTKKLLATILCGALTLTVPLPAIAQDDETPEKPSAEVVESPEEERQSGMALAEQDSQEQEVQAGDEPADDSTAESIAMAEIDSDITLTPGWELFGTCEWRIDENRHLTIRPANNGAVGDLPEFSRPDDFDPELTLDGTYGPSVNWPWNAQRGKVDSVSIEGTVKAHGFMACFLYLSNGGPFEQHEGPSDIDLSGLDVSDVTDMSYMFADNYCIKALDLSMFDTSKVTDLSYMFADCVDLESVELTSFSTSKVENMAAMFDNCNSLTRLDLSSFDTRNVKSMESMFYGCTSVGNLDLSSFNTSNVEDMSFMFDQNYWSDKDDISPESGISSLKEINLTSFDTSQVKSMFAMFAGCENLTCLDLSNFDTSNVTDMAHMFAGCRAMISSPVASFDTSRVNSMSGMFQFCSALTEIDLIHFSTEKVQNLSGMFQGCVSLREIDLSSFHTPDLRSINQSFSPSRFGSWGMFYGCKRLETIKLCNLDTTGLSEYDRNPPLGTGSYGPGCALFNECPSLKQITVGEKFDLQDKFPDKTWYNTKGQEFTPATIPVGVADTYRTFKTAMSISISETAKTVSVSDGPFTLTATVTPPDSFNGAIAWSSSDTSVATVDASGVVTPLRAGTTVISASAGGMSAQCLVTVTEPNVPIVPAESIMLSSNEVTLTGKSTAELSATVMPENATYKAVAWSSSNEKVVRVDTKGMLTAVGKGTATVMATSQDGTVTATCQVAVLNPATRVSVEAMPMRFEVGSSYTLKAKFTGDLPGEVEAPDGIEWKLANRETATIIGNGTEVRLSCVSAGGNTLTVEVPNGGRPFGFNVIFDVQWPDPDSLSISEATKSVIVGSEAFVLTATVTSAVVSGIPVTWSSSDTSVAEVDQGGRVTVLRQGRTTVTAQAGNKSAQCAVTVEARSLPASEDSEFQGFVMATDSATAAKLDGLRVRISKSERAAAEDVRCAAIASSGNNEAIYVDAFDIDLVDAVGNVRPWNEPGNSLVVYVAMDDYMKQLFAERQPGIHFIADDAATTEAKNTWVDGANIAFETTHFSTYALTATPKPVEPEGGQGGGAGGGQGGVTPAAGNQTRVGSLVNSGDSFGVAGIAFGVVALLAAAAGLTLFLRRRSE